MRRCCGCRRYNVAMDVRIAQDLSEIGADDWNRIADPRYPFTSYSFLRALETSNCVAGQSGWHPNYLLALDDGKLIGALPLYKKFHSYGEYVFDWAWARAYAQNGLSYYPKLVVGIPFTPATGPRFLVAPESDQNTVAETLIAATRRFADSQGLSSIHWLFTTETDVARLEQSGFNRRVGCQFHWTNNGYRSFDEFLTTLSSAKRKKILRERRHVSEAGIQIEVRTGDELDSRHWQLMYQFYRRTVDTHAAIPYLTREFFLTLGQTMPDRTVLVLARDSKDYVAGALNFVGQDTLYGRYWGTRFPINGLHFEVCYYRAIEFCIDHGLARFEAGAQGEHKIARGFVPTPTYSAHWLRNEQFANAVEDFLDRERKDMSEYIDELRMHVPFKDGQRQSVSGIATE